MSDLVLAPLIAKPTASFEFTKRKRWRDLLSAELADAFVLIISAARRVLYCSSAISEILGWDSEELIDRDLLEFIPSAEKTSFQSKFEGYMRSNARFLSFVYLSKPVNSEYPRAVLLELSGQRLPFPAKDEEGLCFLVAKTYPGRNVEALNNVLALKIDQERLRQRLMKLKSRSGPLTSASVPHVSQYYPSSSQQQQTDPLNSLYRILEPGICDWDTRLQTTTTGFDDRMGLVPVPVCAVDDSQYVLGSSCTLTEDDNGEEGPRRKKPRRSLALEQFVCITCGRTDSPEWRKGPHGPKTLCNACGLRWAKQMRRIEETGE